VILQDEAAHAMMWQEYPAFLGVDVSRMYHTSLCSYEFTLCTASQAVSLMQKFHASFKEMKTTQPDAYASSLSPAATTQWFDSLFGFFIKYIQNASGLTHLVKSRKSCWLCQGLNHKLCAARSPKDPKRRSKKKVP